MISRRTILKGMAISGLGGFRLAESGFASDKGTTSGAPVEELA